MDDPHDLRRFVDAQAPVFATVLEELTAGRKRTHWMWFVFPQVAGLGGSPMSIKYAIGSTVEARAYLDHAILGARLRQATDLVARHADRPALAIFGAPDHLKFRSCMTLFSAAAKDPALFQEALTLFFDGAPDAATLARLS